MATWNRDDSDLVIGVGIGSTTIGSNLTLSANEIDIASGDFLLDVAGILTLDSGSGNVLLKDDTTSFGSLNNNSGNLLLKSGTTTALTFSGANSTFAGTIQCSINAGDGSSENFVVEQSGLLLKRTSTEVRADLGITDNEILDWTTDQGSNNIHVNNITGDLTIGALSLTGDIQHTGGTEILKLSAKDEDDRMLFAADSGDTDRDAGFLFYTGGVIKWSNQFDADKNVLVWDQGTSTAGAATKMELDSSGNLKITGDITISGGNIITAITFDNGITNAGTILDGVWRGDVIGANFVPNHDDLNGFVANEHIDWTSASAGTIHSSNYSNTQLSAEEVQDIVGAMFTGNTETNTAVTYQDGDGTIDVVTTLDGAPLTTEAVQDIVGAMFTGNTETNTAVTYQDSDGTIDVVSLNDNTTYSAGALLDLSTTTFNVDLTELTDGTADVVGSEDELVYLDDSVQKRKLISEIKLGQFNNDQSWTANTGTVSWDGSTANGVATYKDADEATVESNLTFDGTDLSIAAAGKLILGAGDTSIAESSADTLTFTVGNSVLMTMTETGGGNSVSFTNLSLGVILPYDSKLYFDGGSDTFIVNDGTDQLSFKVGNSALLRLKEDGATNGDHATFGSTGVGFTQFTPSYDATDTYVYFNRSGNKGHLTFGAASTAITDIHMHFPPVSGNFTLVIKQHGSGGGSVTNWKTFDEAGGNESTVVWSGGSAPILTTGANKIDIISIYWDNTNHKAYGVASLNF